MIGTVRYVLLIPVRANIVKQVEDYHWSSGTPLLNDKDDPLANVTPLLAITRDCQRMLSRPETVYHGIIPSHERTGRPLGGNTFITMLEKCIGRALRRRKPGPKKGQD